jgi:hypothetical protein
MIHSIIRWIGQYLDEFSEKGEKNEGWERGKSGGRASHSVIVWHNELVE